MGADGLAGLDFEAVATAAKRLALRIMGQVLAGRLNADRSDQQGSQQPCDCGGVARYAGRRPKTFTTALGEMELERAWYHCQRCHTGFSPRDRALALEGTSLSPAALRMTGLAAARVSFAETTAFLRELAGLDIEPKRVERQAEALGREIAQDERQVIETRTRPDPDPLPRSRRHRRAHAQGRDPRSPRQAARRLRQDPRGQDRRRLVGRHHRPRRRARARPRLRLLQRRHRVCRQPRYRHRALPLRPSRVREAQRRSFDRVPRQVVLGDGAPWIWNWADEHLPPAIQIVDVFHAKQHLFDVAKAIYGAATDLALTWGKQRRDELDQGRFDDLLAALNVHSQTCDDARKCFDYFTRNRQRMRYPAFRTIGLCVSTGVVEAACKNIAGTRLKRGGMHWSLHGANAILALRCAFLSNRFNDFWERRTIAK